MDNRLHFDLPTVLRLAEHACAAPRHTAPEADHRPVGPALLLVSDHNGVHLASNGLPAPAAPAGQPGTLTVLVAFAGQCPPGALRLEQASVLRSGTVVAEVLPLHEPVAGPLIAQLRDAGRAGYTTATAMLNSGGHPQLVLSRRRHRPVRVNTS